MKAHEYLENKTLPILCKLHLIVLLNEKVLLALIPREAKFRNFV